MAELAKIGVPITGEPTLMELVGGLSDAVDAHVYRGGGRTDLGEMAQMGAATLRCGIRVVRMFRRCFSDQRISF